MAPASTTIDQDVVDRALEKVRAYAQVLRPEDVDAPILAPSVAHAVHEWLIEIYHAAELATVGVEPRRLALLYGPPGTGKTTLAHHLAARLGLPLVAVASERLVSPYMGETSNNMGRLFDLLAPIEQHCVLLLDEFDAIGQRRVQVTSSGGVGHERNQAVTVLLRRIEAFRGFGLAATNTKDSLDAAMWRRFGLQISVDLPGEDERFAILRKYAAPFDLPDADFDVLVRVTRGCSPSLLRQLMEGAKRALILAPRLRTPAAMTPDGVFGRVIASIAPPPEMDQPPLWADSERSLRALAGITWPPARLTP